MFRISILFLLSLFLISCSHLHVYQPDIQQGNIISQEKIKKLQTGMTQEQVEDIMGTPVLENIFEPGQLFYIYTYHR